ncbi:predicted protein, partial [Nematostella vectensis]
MAPCQPLDSRWDPLSLIENRRKSLELAREKAECSLAEAQRALEQEKATKSGLGEGVTKLQESLDSVHAVHTKEMAEKNEQLERLRQRTEELTSMLSEAEKKHGMAMLEVKSAERKLQLELEEKNKYKIESERLQGQIHNLKATNFELNQNIESVYEKVEGLHLERAALAEQLEVMETSYAEERLKLEATSAQQTKLIDFLQYKNEGACGKKRKKLLGNILLRLDGDEKVDINCTKLLNEELVLLGAEEGLYALSLTNPGKTKPREVPGIGKAFQIELVPEHNLAIMIA